MALAGYNVGTQIKSLTGTLTPPPLTGSATYTGRYAYATATASNSGALSFVADFGALTISDTSPNVAVSGSITGNQFSGNIVIGLSSYPLQGGFFGTNEMAGTFSDPNAAGIIYGVTP